MDNSPSPVFEEDHAFRYFMKTVIETLPTLFPVFSKEFPPVAAEDMGIVPVSLQENFVKALFFEYHVGRQWGVMWNLYYDDMVESSRNYASMVLYCCLWVYESEEPFYERFLDIFGMVAATSYAFSIGVDIDFHIYAAPLLMVFFDNFMRADFYEAGGWSGLDEYLQDLPYMDWYFVRENLKFRDVSSRFNQEVSWRRSAKSYHHEIRFLSTADAFPNQQFCDLADKVCTMDTSVCDRPDELTAESFLAATNISKVRGLLQKSREPLRVQLEPPLEKGADQDPDEELDQVRKIAEKVAQLRKQADTENSLLRVAGLLVQGIKDQLLQAAVVSDNLALLYNS